MTSKFNVRTKRWLAAAGLAVSVAAAHAAPGFTVTNAQEVLVKPGMSAVEVQSTLGRPAQNFKYADEPGPTWTYGVLGSQDTVFDVDFGSDGRVASVSERVTDDLGGRGGHH